MLEFKEIKEKIFADPCAKLLGVKFLELKPGYAKVSMPVREDMLNFHGTTHGGIIFALADVAFSAASNSHGQLAVALNVNITYLKATSSGNTLIATGVEEKVTRKTGLYRITVEDEMGHLIAVFQGLVYRKEQPLL